MSKILKGVLIYSFIAIAIVLVLAMFVFGIMFFTANSSKPFEVFGYKAIYRSNVFVESKVIATEEFDENDVLNLTINVGNFDAVVLLTDDTTEDIIVRKRDDIFGVYNNVYDPSINTAVESVYDETELLNIITANVTVGQVEGLVTYGGSYVQILVPGIKNFVVNLNIVTTTGDVVINGVSDEDPTQKFTINNLNVETTTGNLTLTKIGSIIEEEYDNQEESLVTMNSIELKTNGGTFDLSNIDNLSVVNEVDSIENKVVINAQLGFFKFIDITAPIRIEGKSVSLQARVLNTGVGGFVYDSPQGYFKIEEIIADQDVSNVIETEMVSIDLLKVSGTTNITTTYGDIKIGTAENAIIIGSEHGDITISNVAKGNVTAISHYGKINVNSYLKRAYFKNNRGTITATYYKAGTFNAETNPMEINAEHLTEVETVTGGVTLNNVFNSITVTITDSATLNVNLTTLPEDPTVIHDINMGTGTATLNLSSLIHFRVNATGNVTGTGYFSTMASKVSTAGQGVTFAVGETANDTNSVLFSVSGKVVFREV